MARGKKRAYPKGPNNVRDFRYEEATRKNNPHVGIVAGKTSIGGNEHVWMG